MKAYTDLEQSKKLVKILSIESADMYYDRYGTPSFLDEYVTNESIKSNKYHHIIPCWSLAALLNVLNTIEGWYPGIDAQVGEEYNWQICMFSYKTGSDIRTAAANKELVNTCYEVILKLYEYKIL